MTATVIRTLAQVLADSDAAVPQSRAFFYDEPVLRAAARRADRVLYTAERDVRAPRAVRQPDGVTLTWRLDRVRYAAGDLPSGELNRSVGHWNPPDQWEIFMVERGEVAIVVTAGAPGEVELVRCGPGETACLRPGCWHLTYVLDGPAVVANLYCERAGSRNGAAGKYFTRPVVQVGLRRVPGAGPGAMPGLFTDGAPGPVRWERGRSGGAMPPGARSLDELLASPDGAALLADPPRRYPRLHPCSEGSPA